MGTPLPSLRSSPESIISSILCMPREPSSIGTSERVWKKVNSPKPEKILPPSRRIMKKSVSKPLREKVKKKAWNDHFELVSLKTLILYGRLLQAFHILKHYYVIII